MAGKLWYRQFLRDMYNHTLSESHIEIGLRQGGSLSESPANKKVAVDPSFDEDDLRFSISGEKKFYKKTSDAFFSEDADRVLAETGFDTAFVDGMHLFEYVLRDFINLESYAKPTSVILIDDVLPRTSGEASRTPTGGGWTGDVWKILPCLIEYRSDLHDSLYLVDTHPTGTLVIAGLDHTNRVLADNYENILEKYLELGFDAVRNAEMHRWIIPPSEVVDALAARIS